MCESGSTVPALPVGFPNTTEEYSTSAHVSVAARVNRSDHMVLVVDNRPQLSGASMCWLSAYKVPDVIRLLPECTVMMGVPTYYTRLLADRNFDRRAEGLCPCTRLQRRQKRYRRQSDAGNAGHRGGYGQKMTSVTIDTINVVFVHQALPFAWLKKGCWRASSSARCYAWLRLM